MEIVELVLTSLCLLMLVLIWVKTNSKNGSNVIDSFRNELKNESKENRTELAASLTDNRKELAEGLNSLTKKLEEKLTQISEGLTKNAKDNRQELNQSLKDFSTQFSQNIKDFNDLQKDKFDAMTVKQDELIKSTELKLEKMRETVDEKLHKTLEERLGQSFKLVSDRLEAVQKGLGEMQNLASDVGDLKNVLGNVKTRGVLGEIQLGNILEQIMAPEQYESNVKTKQGSNDHVEFAIKLPGKDDYGNEVYLPVDAKFPQENYVRLQEAYDNNDKKGILDAKKALIQSIKKFARDIRDKYIDPPNTTDFGIMFLPVEGLFAEVVRQPDLVATLQREFKIIITGPTTLAAMLNSLQMGFKTLAIQKRSSEVWDILGAVKTEFGKFGGVLDKAQKKINEANRELDSLVGTRTRIMMSKLKKVEELPSSSPKSIIPDTLDSNRNDLGLEES